MHRSCFRNDPREFHLDVDDRLIYVSHQWRDEAVQDDVFRITPACVGTKLWTCLEGGVFRSRLRQLVQAIRRTRGVAMFPFRHDRPDAAVDLEMEVVWVKDGVLVCFSRTMAVTPVQQIPNLAPPVISVYEHCTFCRSVNTIAGWVHVGPQLVHWERRRGGSSGPPPLGVCSGCEERFDHLCGIGNLRSVPVPTLPPHLRAELSW